MVRIVWNKNIEPEHKAEIEKYLTEFLFLVPKWCQSITINLYDADGKAAVTTLVDYEYRAITLDFYSCWLTQSPEIKQDNVIHECVHFFINELYHQARRVVIATCKNNEQMKDFAFSELEKTVEAVTQDLTFAIMNKFNEQ